MLSLRHRYLQNDLALIATAQSKLFEVNPCDEYWMVRISGLDMSYWAHMKLDFKINFSRRHPYEVPIVMYPYDSPFNMQQPVPNFVVDGQVRLNILNPSTWNGFQTTLLDVINEIIDALLKPPIEPLKSPSAAVDSICCGEEIAIEVDSHHMKLADLSDVFIHNILEFASIVDICQVACCSKRFLCTCNSQDFWAYLYYSRFLVSSSLLQVARSLGPIRVLSPKRTWSWFQAKNAYISAFQMGSYNQNFFENSLKYRLAQEQYYLGRHLFGQNGNPDMPIGFIHTPMQGVLPPMQSQYFTPLGKRFLERRFERNCRLIRFLFGSDEKYLNFFEKYLSAFNQSMPLSYIQFLSACIHRMHDNVSVENHDIVVLPNLLYQRNISGKTACADDEHFASLGVVDPLFLASLTKLSVFQKSSICNFIRRVALNYRSVLYSLKRRDLSGYDTFIKYREYCMAGGQVSHLSTVGCDRQSAAIGTSALLTVRLEDLLEFVYEDHISNSMLFRQLKPGSLVDALDYQGQWMPALVKKPFGRKIFRTSNASRPASATSTAASTPSVESSSEDSGDFDQGRSNRRRGNLSALDYDADMDIVDTSVNQLTNCFGSIRFDENTNVEEEVFDYAKATGITLNTEYIPSIKFAKKYSSLISVDTKASSFNDWHQAFIRESKLSLIQHVFRDNRDESAELKSQRMEELARSLFASPGVIKACVEAMLGEEILPWQLPVTHTAMNQCTYPNSNDRLAVTLSGDLKDLLNALCPLAETARGAAMKCCKRMMMLNLPSSMKLEQTGMPCSNFLGQFCFPRLSSLHSTASIHFLGYGSRFDEIIPMNSTRLAPFRSRSERKLTPAAEMVNSIIKSYSAENNGTGNYSIWDNMNINDSTRLTENLAGSDLLEIRIRCIWLFATPGAGFVRMLVPPHLTIGELMTEYFMAMHLPLVKLESSHACVINMLSACQHILDNRFCLDYINGKCSCRHESASASKKDGCSLPRGVRLLRKDFCIGDAGLVQTSVIDVLLHVEDHENICYFTNACE